MRLIYLVGEPGAGKSTLLAAALPAPHATVPQPFMHELAGDLVVLGRLAGDFPGTDRLSLSVQPRVLTWLAEARPPLVVGEGDRLATLGFLRGAWGLGYYVILVHLSVPEAVGEERRQARARALGRAPQSPSWVAGRRTKVANLVAGWEGDVVKLDGRRPTHELACTLHGLW